MVFQPLRLNSLRKVKIIKKAFNRTAKEIKKTNSKQQDHHHANEFHAVSTR